MTKRGPGRGTQLHCDMDPWVTEVMINMGFVWDQIQDSLAGRKYDHMMATYVTLSIKKAKVEGDTTVVSPLPFPDLSSCSPAPSREVSAHSGKCSCSGPAFSTWICTRENQRCKEQESG